MLTFPVLLNLPFRLRTHRPSHPQTRQKSYSGRTCAQRERPRNRPCIRLLHVDPFYLRRYGPVTGCTGVQD